MKHEKLMLNTTNLWIEHFSCFAFNTYNIYLLHRYYDNFILSQFSRLFSMFRELFPVHHTGKAPNFF